MALKFVIESQRRLRQLACVKATMKRRAKSEAQLLDHATNNLLRALKRDMLNLSENVHNFARKFIDINWKTTERILLHERTSIDIAHPRPNSTA